MPLAPVNTPIPPGESRRYQCDDCLVEFEITNEPKCAEMETITHDKSNTPSHCPFCGSNNFTEV